MNENQYKDAIADAGLNQRQASRLFKVAERTGRAWALGERRVPHAVALVLGLLAESYVTIRKVEKVGEKYGAKQKSD